MTYFIKKIAVFVLIASIAIPYSVSAEHRSYDGGEGFEQSIGDWRRGSSELRNKIDDLDNDIVEDLPIPVLFGVAVKNLTRNFGDPRGEGRIHEGLDIMAAEGLPVVSPTEAVVIRIGNGDSSGNYVSTANPGGESFVYMHLSKVANIDEGDVLDAGDLIGYVGHTGNAVAAAPHLHFEIHDEDRDAIDPYSRLTKVFSLEDKIEFLPDIFDDTNDEEELADLLVQKARADFTAAALNDDIELPDEIIDALKKTTALVISSTANSSILKVGSRGLAVQALQEFLVKKDVGTASLVKADGVFGPITRQAVIDYQASVDLVSDGVAGPKTLAYISTQK